MSITLQDVEVIFGLPIDSEVLVGPTAVVEGAWSQLCMELLGFTSTNDNKTLVGQRILISRLIDASAAPLQRHCLITQRRFRYTSMPSAIF